MSDGWTSEIRRVCQDCEGSGKDADVSGAIIPCETCDGEGVETRIVSLEDLYFMLEEAIG
jgi:DnaJ-class molecular chaperone